MGFDQTSYIEKYNKENYKMYQFRVKKDNPLIRILDEKQNRNAYIINLIENDCFNGVLTLKEIKQIIMPILSKYDIFEVYLFGSYARGEANVDSDVDILCEDGKIKTLIEMEQLIEELELSLNKKVDLIFLSSKLNEYFEKEMRNDLIKLC